MEYSKLGNSNLQFSRLCVGCMSFGDHGSNFHAWTLNAEESEMLVKRALDLGINFFDTANIYSAGTSIHRFDYNTPIEENAIGAFNVKLTSDDIAYLEELYVPHKIIGAL